MLIVTSVQLPSQTNAEGSSLYGCSVTKLCRWNTWTRSMRPLQHCAAPSWGGTKTQVRLSKAVAATLHLCNMGLLSIAVQYVVYAIGGGRTIDNRRRQARPYNYRQPPTRQAAWECFLRSQGVRLLAKYINGRLMKTGCRWRTDMSRTYRCLSNMGATTARRVSAMPRRLQAALP